MSLCRALKGRSLLRVPERDMEVQMLGILVSPKIGENSAAAVLCLDVCSYVAYDVQQPVKN